MLKHQQKTFCCLLIFVCILLVPVASFRLIQSHLSQHSPASLLHEPRCKASTRVKSSSFLATRLPHNQIRSSLESTARDILGSNAVSSIFSGQLSPISRLAQAFPLHLVLYSMLKLKNTQTLTHAGLLHATLLGCLLWYSVGPAGWSVAVVYFILGSVVTKFKLAYKQV